MCGIVQEYVHGVVDLSPEVWSPSSAKILDTPVGSPEFVSNLIEERLDEERKLWQRSLGCQTFSARGRYSPNAQLRDSSNAQLRDATIG